MTKNLKLAIGLTSATVLAAGTGFLASTALSQGAQEPTTTTTITLTNGATGATGPTGPAGPSGGTECPAGSQFGELVINHPGGHVTILTCIVG